MEEKMSAEQFAELKSEMGALVLAHFYVDYSVQQMADFVGDSFELAKKAREAKEDTIVFCGVKFMGESAKLLCPDKKVILPDMSAMCPMADTITPDDVAALREKYPEAAIVCYVNSSAETKALCDICCTSSNAEKVVRSLPNKQIVFVPDKNLGSYIKDAVPEKEVIVFNGCCPIHNGISLVDAINAKKKYPNALFLCHPECIAEVSEMADYVGSTSGIIRYAEQSDKTEFIIGTENGVVDRLSHMLPAKKFYPLSPKFICSNMKKITPENLVNALLYGGNEVELSDEIAQKAKLPLERMMNIK